MPETRTRPCSSVVIVATREAPKNVTLGPVAGARSVTVALATGLPRRINHFQDGLGRNVLVDIVDPSLAREHADLYRGIKRARLWWNH